MFNISCCQKKRQKKIPFLTMSDSKAIDYTRCVSFNKHILENISYTAYHALSVCLYTNEILYCKSLSPNCLYIMRLLFKSFRFFILNVYHFFALEKWSRYVTIINQYKSSIVFPLNHIPHCDHTIQLAGLFIKLPFKETVSIKSSDFITTN